MLLATAPAAVFAARQASLLPNATVTVSAKEISAARIQAHMTVLADDAMQGRETGTPGFDRAAEYVADQFRGLRLQGINGGNLQQITIRRTRVDERGSALTVTALGQRRTLAYANDFVTYGMRGAASVSAEGPLMFVGDGVSVPQHGVDAYRGLDVAGKIVVALPGGPPSFSPSERSFYADATHKVANAAAHGAAALLLVDAPQIPWDLRVRAARQLGVSEAMPTRDRESVIPLVYLQRETAEGILGSLDRPTLQAGLLVGSVQLMLRQVSHEVSSANVVARLPGSDPRRVGEHIVLMAHLDHVGVGEPISGDAVYNGAVDNASGVAALLTMAKAFLSLPRRPARSLVFLATTGEEQGLIGAEYFVRRSDLVPGEIVAALNVDGTSVTPFEHLDVRGGSNSSLGATSQAAGRQLSVAIRLEPLGVGGSDHSPFLLAGIPVLWVGASLPSEWMRTHYHTPQDDMRQALDLEAAARYTRFMFLTTYLAADASARPTWNAGEFFGKKRAR